MSEELHEITYQQTVTETYTRTQIEEIAIGSGYFEDVVLACREWLAANPQGMTRDEFNALPDGTVVRAADRIEYIKSGGSGGYSEDERIVWFPFSDEDLIGMTVVSTPAPPTLDDVDFVRGASGIAYYRGVDSLWRNMSPESDPLKLLDIQMIENESPLTPLLPGPQIGGDT